jgi:hypothetical protein
MKKTFWLVDQRAGAGPTMNGTALPSKRRYVGWHLSSGGEISSQKRLHKCIKILCYIYGTLCGKNNMFCVALYLPWICP